jgi:hypothetical protein
MQSPKTLAGTFASGLPSQVRCSVSWSAFSPRRFFVDDQETMSTMTIVFVLIILLFGFDSTREVKTRGQHNHG